MYGIPKKEIVTMNYDSLETDAGRILSTARAPPSEVSVEMIRANNLRIAAIREEDLTHLERDLPFDAKVSIVFLLHGADNPHFACQRLIIAALQPKQPTTFLFEWAKQNSTEWRNPIIEALLIIKANRIIEKLGLDIVELTERFFPKRAEVSVHIYRPLKALYRLCETFDSKTTHSLITFIRTENPNAVALNFTNQNHLEIHLLNWIIEKIIKIKDNDSHVTPIIAFLKQNEMDDMKSVLENAVTSSSTFRTDAEIPHTSRAVLENVLSYSNRQIKPTSDRMYDLTAGGYCLIVNQYLFEKDPDPKFKDIIPKEPLLKREGTDFDEHVLFKTFDKFGFIPFTERNLKHADIIKSVRNIASLSGDFSAVVVCILSHGQQNVVFGSNSVPVDIEAIQNAMSSEKLLNKPKILIVQACQGTELQTAVPLAKPKLQYDGFYDTKTAPCSADLVTAYSTVPRYASIRDPSSGSWYIQTLCKKLQEFSETKDFVDILTLVTEEVSQIRGPAEECVVPQFTSSLSRKLYFRTKS